MRERKICADLAWRNVHSNKKNQGENLPNKSQHEKLPAPVCRFL